MSQNSVKQQVTEIQNPFALYSSVCRADGSDILNSNNDGKSNHEGECEEAVQNITAGFEGLQQD